LLDRTAMLPSLQSRGPGELSEPRRASQDGCTGWRRPGAVQRPRLPTPAQFSSAETAQSSSAVDSYRAVPSTGSPTSFSQVSSGWVSGMMLPAMLARLEVLVPLTGPCAFCHRRPTSRKGEHVAPLWFLRGFPVTQPYTTYTKGTPTIRFDGTNRTQSSLTRFQVPCCDGDVGCNKALNDRFEKQHTQALVRRLYDSIGSVDFSVADSADLGLWLVKTWLLLAHPRMRSSDPDFRPGLWAWTPSLYSWMTNGAMPPEDLSMWVYRQSARSAAKPHVLSLVTLSTVEQRYRTQVSQLSFAGLGCSLVHHPGRRFRHPLVERRRAVQVWPPSPDGIRTTGLPRVGRNPVVWQEGPKISLASGVGKARAREALPAVNEETEWVSFALSNPDLVVGFRA